MIDEYLTWKCGGGGEIGCLGLVHAASSGRWDEKEEEKAKKQSHFDCWWELQKVMIKGWESHGVYI